MRILASARDHGITDDQIRSALEVPMRRVQLDDDLLLVLGADTAAQLLEIIVADPESNHPRVIHAMPLRPKFYRYL